MIYKRRRTRTIGASCAQWEGLFPGENWTQAKPGL